ncbi:MAG: hypothetical protein CMF56_01285 [Leifsonia sp.]|nr:hypothetical protein [Leifsonia sp.]|tara:strand:- start:24830 stop:25243 length:414 start_codon:yes stop_codon:yes gene_type:complete
MATVTPTPLYFKDAIITIGTDDYAAAVSSGALTPNVSVARFTGLKPTADYKDIDIDWSLDLTFAQDWASTDSLSNKLWTAQGTVLEDCTIKPQSGAGPTFTVDLLIVPGAVGGTSRSHATATVSLPVVGQPAFSAPA